MPRSGNRILSALVSRTSRGLSGPGTVSSCAALLLATTAHATGLLADEHGSSGRYPCRVPERHEPESSRRSRQFDDELLGLDPDDPDAQAFAAHLDRMQQTRPAFTVEGYLDGVRDFADSANRAEGGRRWAAVLVVVLLLLGVVYVVSRALAYVLSTWF
jgi:hypothetical protein